MSRPPLHILVTAAWLPELERFQSLLRAEPRADVVTEAMGIGLADAAIGLTRCVMTRRPTHVLALGTAGAAPRSGLAVGTVVVGQSARLVDATAVEGRSALPFSAEAPFDAAMVDALFSAGARPCVIANPLGITTDDALAATLGVLAPVEHLEAYAVARTCQALGVPSTIVLGIANIVGSKGREQWRANHVAASASAAEIAFKALPAMCV
jgi:nucleoside phosphorylase